MGDLRRTLAMTRAAGAVLRAERRLALVPLAALAVLGVLAVTTAGLTSRTLQFRDREFGSAYRTAGFGVRGAQPPSSTVVTTIVPTWATPVVLLACYLLAAFVATCAVAVVAAVTHQRLRGEPV